MVPAVWHTKVKSGTDLGDLGSMGLASEETKGKGHTTVNTATTVNVTEGKSAGDRLQLFLDSGRKLPIPPTVMLRLFELGKDPDSSPSDYANVISACSSLATKIIATVNSSWFGIRHRVDKVVQAVNLLGVANVRVLAIAHCLAAVHSRVSLEEEVLENYWQVSLLKAVAARYVAKRLDERVADEALLIGLMQDMALPVMHQIAPELYEAPSTTEALAHQALAGRERELFGRDHSQAAYALAQSLGIPEELAVWLRDHHEKLSDQPDALEVAVRFAGLLPHWMHHWAGVHLSAATDLLEQHLGRPRADLMGVLEEIQNEFQAMANKIRPSGVERVDLPSLVEEAAIEMADSTVGLVSQVHSLMSNAFQIDRQMTEMNMETLQLQQRSQEDPLTGVLNRHGLEEVGQGLLGGLRAMRQSLSVWFVDVDDFKHINDHWGHAVGDQVLVHVAATMRRVLGEDAILARYGGDEFVALLGSLEPGQVELLARQILEEVSLVAVPGAGQDVRVGLSIGGLYRAIAPDTTLDEMVKTADTAMYRVKTEGKGNVILDQVAGE